MLAGNKLKICVGDAGFEISSTLEKRVTKMDEVLILSEF